MEKGLIFAHISSSSVLIPIVMGVLFRRYLSFELRLILYLLVCAAVSDGISLFLIFKRINTWPIVNLFMIIQLVIVMVVFSYQLKFRLIRFGIAGFTFFSVLNYFFFEGLSSFNAITLYGGGILGIALSLLYLLKLMQELPAERISDLPMFWITFGFLTYYCGSLFLFLFNNYLLRYQLGMHMEVWILHNILNVTKNVFLAIAVWKNFRYRIYLA